MAKVVGASLNPDDMVAGGLFDDVNVKFDETRFTMFDYGGTRAEKTPAILSKMTDRDTGDEYEQYWSMGSGKDWVPSDDGKRMTFTGTKRKDEEGNDIVPQLTLGTNGAIFLKSLVDAGFPKDKMGAGDISVIDGMVAHVVRVAAPKRSGIEKTPRADGKDFGPARILTVEEIITMPWDKDKGAGAPKTAGKKAKGKAKGKDTGSTASSGNLNDLATEFLMEELVNKGGEIAKGGISIAAFAKFRAREHNERNELLRLVTSDEFLSNGPWTFEENIIKLG